MRDVDDQRVESTDIDGEPGRAITGIEDWFETLEQQAIADDTAAFSLSDDAGRWLELPDDATEGGGGYERTA